MSGERMFSWNVYTRQGKTKAFSYFLAKFDTAHQAAKYVIDQIEVESDMLDYQILHDRTWYVYNIKQGLWVNKRNGEQMLPLFVPKSSPEEVNTVSDRREAVNHPSHYGGDTTYEAIKVISAWELNFNLGSVLKYVCRAGKKYPDKLEDLRKAAWYLNDEIKKLEKEKS